MGLLFEEVRTVRAAALVYLLAQIHRLRIEYGEDRVVGTYPNNPRVEQVLIHTGFYDLLGVKARSKTLQSKAVRFIKFRSFQKPQASEIGKLREELLGSDLTMPTAIARTVFRALGEAMINVNQHAYVRKEGHLEIRGRWWMLAALNARKNTFTLTFYDAGVGIPKTLPLKYTSELIQYILSLLPGIPPNDGQMLSAAMALGRSRTELGHRGKGLMDLAHLIDVVGAGRMDIYSRRGSFRYMPTGTSDRGEEGFVEGTLIEWRLPLDKALNRLPKEMYDDAEAEA